MPVEVDTGEFLGRADERRRWMTTLEESRKAPRSELRSFMVLVYGIGGMGKSQLTNRLVEIAKGEVASDGQVVRPSFPTVLIDLEVERQRLPDRYPALEGPSVGTLLYTVERAVCEQLDKRSMDAFANFRSVLATILELVRSQDRVRIEREREGSVLSERELAGLKDAAILVGGLAGVTISSGAVAAASVAGFGLARLARRIKSRKKPEVDVSQQRIDLALDPERVLINAFSEGMKKVSQKHGLVVALDTGEIADRAMGAIRGAAQCSGSSVVWLVAGRFDTPAESGYEHSAVARFEREIADDRLSPIAISAFDRALQRDYLQSRLERNFDESELEKLDSITRGIPLALQLVVGMLRDGVDLDDLHSAVGEKGQPSKLVKGLAERFLHHAIHGVGQGSETLREDMKAIFGLVVDETAEAGTVIGFELQRAILASLLDVNPSDLRARLDGLAARHDFVLAATGRVHQEVSSVLLDYLLAPDQRSRYTGMHERTVKVIREELGRRNESLDVGQRINDDAWRVLAAALMRHEFWISNSRGIRALANLLPQAVVLKPEFATLLWTTASKFVATASESDRKLLGGTQQPGAARLLRSTVMDPELGCPPSTRTCLLELMAAGEEAAGGAWEQVYAHVRSAAAVEGIDDPAIHAAVGALAEKVGAGLIFSVEGFSRRSDAGLEACRLATKYNRESVEARRMLGIALREAKEREAAMAEFDRAIALDDRNPYVHHSRAITLQQLEEFDEALKAHDIAIELRSDYAYGYIGRGATLGMTGRYTEALTSFEKAVELEPMSAAAHVGLSAGLADLGQYSEGLSAAETAIEIESGLVWAHAERSRALDGLGRSGEALNSIETAFAYSSDRAWLLIRKGLLLSLGERPEEGIEPLEEAVRIDAELVDAWGNLAVLHRTVDRKGRSAAADAAFEDALRAGEAQHPAKKAEWRAISQAALGNPRAAIAELATLQCKAPAWAYQPRLYALLRRKQFEGLAEIENHMKGAWQASRRS